MMLSNEVDNAPPAVPLLNVPERQHCNFGSAEPTAEKQGENGPVPEPLRGRDVWCAQQRLGLAEREPVSGVRLSVRRAVLTRRARLARDCERRTLKGKWALVLR